jgi:hypothetical protein
MNITGFIFLFVFLVCLGNVTGKLFKNMNPFLVMIGLVLLLGFFPMIDQQDNMLFFVAFALGFLENFFSVFGLIRDGFYNIRYRLELNSSVNKAHDDLERQKSEHEEDLRRQKRAAEDDLQRQRKDVEEQLRRDNQEAEERLRRAKEDLKRQREETEQQKNKKTGSKREQSTNNESMMPQTFAEACEVLGVDQSATLAECKKAKRSLAAMYHPDKFEQFTGKRRKQAEIEFQKIMCAWDIVEKKKK